MKLLIDESPIVVLPTLAEKIGINEAIIVQQIHYWITQQKNFVEGRYWVYNTYEDWQLQFKWLHIGTIKRLIAKLQSLNIIIIRNLSKNKNDRTNWYSLNYEVLNNYCDEPKQEEQNVATDSNNLLPSIVTKCDYDIYTKTNTKNNTKTNDDYFLGLFNGKQINEEFLETWKQWIDYRKSIKKKVTEMIAKKQIEFILQQSNPIECIKQSIRNGWQGLFPLKTYQTHIPKELSYEELLELTKKMTPEERQKTMQQYKPNNGKFIFSN
ncbi:MAG: hypothetical protein AB1695_12620 [Stygiobacter sp.]